MLAPAALSSGEKQLLLLFCNVIAAKNRTALFLLDEPELSLNIKWQRKLLQTLLQLIGDSPVQLLVATHSLELLSSYRSHVLPLNDIRG
jgi:energy-coupling factor transporter ATP-binding protein EcfA2